jgi:type IV secretory pathway VirJ component
MKLKFAVLTDLTIIFSCFVACVLFSHTATAKESTVAFSHFGDVRVYSADARPTHLVLFMSDDAGWDSSMEKMAKLLASGKTVVAGIDTPRYRARLESLKAKCAYPAGDLENLSKFMQATLGFAAYSIPLVIGNGAGGAFAYGAHAQAPENTFLGAIGYDFCPQYKLKKSICPGDGFSSAPMKISGSHVIQAGERAIANWVVINGRKNLRCSEKVAKAFARQVKGGRFIATEADSEANEQLRTTTNEILKKGANDDAKPGAVASLSDLPLVLVEPTDEARKKAATDYFVVLYTGDGGWAGFDKDIAKGFQDIGVPVVGFSTLSYFWKARTPDASAADFQRVLSYFQNKWALKKVVLLGYSFGADVAPFLVTRLPEDLQKSVLQITLMSSSGFGEFEFKFAHWFSETKKGLPLAPELEKLAGKVRVQCLYGTTEKEPYCPELDAKKYQVLKLPGGHRFDGDTPKLIKLIQDGATAPLKSAP